MPLVERLPVGDGCAQWDVWGTVARIVVTEPARLGQAVEVVRAELAAVDAACSRFRPDSELSRTCDVAGRPVPISDLLVSLLTTALAAAKATDGDVDPTVGARLSALGYDRDFAALGARRRAGDAYDADDGGQANSNGDGNANGVGDSDTAAAPAWREIRLHGNVLTVPAGARIDLGATAKAWAADRCAQLVALQCDTGVLVALGGDIATAGPASDGWRILVQDGPGEPASSVTVPAGAAIATSSTISRTWRRASDVLHHIVDPRTGRPANPVWRTVSAVAHTCVDANTMTTAAVVRGLHAPAWLDRLGVPARFVGADGAIRLLNGWASAEPTVGEQP